MPDIPDIDVDLWADDVPADPYPAHARLRDLGPVLYERDRNVYVLIRNDEIRSAVRDWETFSFASGIGVSHPRAKRC